MTPFFTTDIYDHDVIIVKRFGEHLTKVIFLSSVRKRGYEAEDKAFSKKGSVNDVKLDVNLSRAKSKVKELVLCNPWDYWCTFTISPEKYDRYDLKVFYKAFSEFIHSYNRRCEDSDKVKYILVPEKHKDGAWHMHGFIKGIRKKDLFINSNGYLSWKQYNDKFGFISMDNLRDSERASSYMMKYMTKDTFNNVSELGAHLYYASKRLNVAESIFQGHAEELPCDWDWDWEHPDGYFKIKTLDDRKGEDISKFLEIIG